MLENKELEKVKINQPQLFNNLLNKIIEVGETSANTLLEIINDPTTPNEVKMSVAGGLLKQVMDFLTANNGNGTNK